MIPANIMWISDKGYGFVMTEDKVRAYVPSHVMSRIREVTPDMKVKVVLEDSDKGKRVAEIMKMDEIA